MNSGPPLADRRWLILGSAVVSFFAVGVSFFAVPPLVPELIDRFGLDHLRIGVLMGAIAVPAVFLSIPLGLAVDRWPARAAGNAGLVLMAVGAGLFALAPSYMLLVVGRLLFGLGGLVLNLLLARLITTAFAGRELSLAMGIFNSVYPASMIVMFSLHPRMLSVLGWRGELLALAAMAVVALPLHNLAVPAGGHASDSPDRHFRRHHIPSGLMALAAAWMLFFGAFAAVLTFAPEWAGGDAAALLTVTLLMWTTLILNPAIGAAIDRSGRAVLWIAAGLLALAGALAAMAAGVISAAPAMILIGIGASAVLTATYSVPGRLVPPEQVGFAFGFITAFSNLATLAGPAGVGALRDAVESWSAPWAVLAFTCLVGAVIASRIRYPER
jgi:predicted MFS family arabinose efflux permease